MFDDEHFQISNCGFLFQKPFLKFELLYLFRVRLICECGLSASLYSTPCFTYYVQQEGVI